jgi:hypothetical protein
MMDEWIDRSIITPSFVQQQDRGVDANNKLVNKTTKVAHVYKLRGPVSENRVCKIQCLTDR